MNSRERRKAKRSAIAPAQHPIAAHGAHDDGPMKYPVTFPDGQARIFDTPEEATIATRAWVEAENLRAKGRRTILGLADGEEWGVGALLAAGAVLLVLAAIVVLVWPASGSGAR